MSDSLPRFDEAFLRKLERLSVVAKRVAALHGQGQRRSHRAGSGIEFADHRDYQPGDDLRRLDWNLYGRLERPMVRMFDEDEDLPVYVLVDTSASMGIGTPSKLGLAVQIAAALGYVALSALDRVAIFPVAESLGTGLGPLRGKSRIQNVFNLLAALRPSGQTSFTDAASQLLTRHRRRGVVVMLSDFLFATGYHETINRLRYGRFKPVVVQITSPQEADPTLGGDVVLVDAESGAHREVTVTAAVRAAYRMNFANRRSALDRFCRQHAVPCFQVPSTCPFEDLVLRMFRSGGVLS